MNDKILSELKKLNEKIDKIVLMISLQGKEEKDSIKILKGYSKKDEFSKRELERMTGISRHKF